MAAVARWTMITRNRRSGIMGLDRHESRRRRRVPMQTAGLHLAAAPRTQPEVAA
jgi:hypothetical protein